MVADPSVELVVAASNLEVDYTDKGIALTDIRIYRLPQSESFVWNFLPLTVPLTV